MKKLGSIVCSPLSKGWNPNFENLKKGGGKREPEKKIWGGGNQKGGGQIFKNKGGNPTF